MNMAAVIQNPAGTVMMSTDSLSDACQIADLSAQRCCREAIGIEHHLSTDGSLQYAVAMMSLSPLNHSTLHPLTHSFAHPGSQSVLGCMQELQPQLQRHIQAVQALGAALKAAMAEHACSADMQALDSANTALTGIRSDLCS